MGTRSVEGGRSGLVLSKAEAINGAVSGDRVRGGSGWWDGAWAGGSDTKPNKGQIK